MVAMPITLTLTASVNLHFFWTYENKEGTTGKHCSTVSKYESFLIGYRPWITLSFILSDTLYHTDHNKYRDYTENRPF